MKEPKNNKTKITHIEEKRIKQLHQIDKWDNSDYGKCNQGNKLRNVMRKKILKKQTGYI